MEAKKKRKFDFKWLCRLKTKLYIWPPNFFLNSKSFYIGKSWGALVPIFGNLPPFGPWTNSGGSLDTISSEYGAVVYIVFRILFIINIMRRIQ